jgi:hypothetical protein
MSEAPIASLNVRVWALLEWPVQEETSPSAIGKADGVSRPSEAAVFSKRIDSKNAAYRCKVTLIAEGTVPISVDIYIAGYRRSCRKCGSHDAQDRKHFCDAMTM